MHIEYLQDGSTLYDFVDTRIGYYSPEEMEEATKVQNGSPTAIFEDKVSTMNDVARVAESAVTAGMRLANVGARASMLIGGLYNAVTGWNRPVRGTPMIM
jgi:hypothetical protein